MTNDDVRESADCVDFMYKIDERNNTIKFIFSDGTVKTANLGALKGIWDAQSEFKKKAEVVISQLRADRDRLEDATEKIRAEIEALQNANPSYWHSGDMVDRDDVLDIIDKYKAESEVSDEDCD